MDNHLHLQIKPLGSTDLSKLMQWVLSQFARAYNKMKGYIGHVFYDRFKSIIIDDLPQLYATILYIWRNPSGISTDGNFSTYKFSGYYHLKKKDYSLIEPPDEHTQYCLDFIKTES